MKKYKNHIYLENMKQAKTFQSSLFYSPKNEDNLFQLQNRRYIGNKYKLINWIFSIINSECVGSSFADIFAGTGVVGSVAAKYFDKVILNDFLYSNHVVYKAFFDSEEWNKEKIAGFVEYYNNLKIVDLPENYFSINFGDKYFSKESAKIIGFIRDHIEINKFNFTDREYNILLSSLLYSADKIANTVGHYDAYFRSGCREDDFKMCLINPIEIGNFFIFRKDANLLVKDIETDIVYIDPPYNSRQYSRFYHVLETLVKWDKQRLYGVALKPIPENMSDYCRITAKERFAELIREINSKYIAVSYNNTYNSRSASSRNKISLDEIVSILRRKGHTQVFDTDYRHFNAGNTSFDNHKEYLFVTRTDYE